MTKKNKKNRKPVGPVVRPQIPVSKPNNEHMPICSAPGCNRKVSDARKGRCGHCQATNSANDAYEYWEMYGYD